MNGDLSIFKDLGLVRNANYFDSAQVGATRNISDRFGIFSYVADNIGERESYRLEGKATLTAEQILAGQLNPDAVARGCFPVDIHRADSAALATQPIGGAGYYDIPLGCLECATVPNLLCAGRCLSADREGFASARVLPTAIATGQAAGLIAAWRACGKIVEASACLSAVSLV